MDRTLRISRSALAAIRVEADAADDEICGLLLGAAITEARAWEGAAPGLDRPRLSTMNSVNRPRSR